MYVEMTMEATSVGQMLRARPWGLGGAATSTVVGQAEGGGDSAPWRHHVPAWPGINTRSSPVLTAISDMSTINPGMINQGEERPTQ